MSKYTNQDLLRMIIQLQSRNIITQEVANKMKKSLLKTSHSRLPDDQARKKAQRENALNWYYRKKLINLTNKFPPPPPIPPKDRFTPPAELFIPPAIIAAPLPDNQQKIQLTIKLELPPEVELVK